MQIPEAYNTILMEIWLWEREFYWFSRFSGKEISIKEVITLCRLCNKISILTGRLIVQSPLLSAVQQSTEGILVFLLWTLAVASIHSFIHSVLPSLKKKASDYQRKLMCVVFVFNVIMPKVVFSTLPWEKLNLQRVCLLSVFSCTVMKHVLGTVVRHYGTLGYFLTSSSWPPCLYWHLFQPWWKWCLIVYYLLRLFIDNNHESLGTSVPRNIMPLRRRHKMYWFRSASKIN